MMFDISLHIFGLNRPPICKVNLSRLANHLRLLKPSDWVSTLNCEFKSADDFWLTDKNVQYKPDYKKNYAMGLLQHSSLYCQNKV